MSNMIQATFGGGCFWCVEAVVQRLKGVHKVESGYSGGSSSDADYKKVCSGGTDHVEVVQVTFDPAQISYDSSRRGLVETFLTQEERNGRYDQVLYQLVLANLQLLLAGDEAGVIDSIQFTGWLEGSLSDGHKGRVTLLTLTLDKAAVAALARQGNELGGVVFEELYRLQGITPLRQIDRLARPRLPASRGVAELEQDASPEQAS